MAFLSSRHLLISATSVLFLALLASASLPKPQQQAPSPVRTFTVDASTSVGPWSHYFENCVGSGHAALALRADYQAFMTRCHNELGVKQVRFHGLFVDDMSVVLDPTNPKEKYSFSFFNIDRIFDFFLSINMKPFVEISFMPDLLASGNKTWSHYKANVTPPKNWADWASLIKSFIAHLIDRYGIEEVLQWNFEVWNEPNCCPSDFYTGSQKDYFQLFEVTSRAIKSVDPRVRVGGPATAMSAWIGDFISYCKSNNVSYDFISTHEYPTDPPGPETRTFFSEALKRTRATAGLETPVYYTEYDDGYNDATSYAAAFIAYQIYKANGVVDALSWWVFSDLFEEAGMRPDPFNLDWMPVAGLMNVYGIPKPSYRAFQLLHWSGDSLLSTIPDVDFYGTVGVYAVGGNGTSIFVTNWFPKRYKNITKETVSITILGTSLSQIQRGYLIRIDSQNTDARPTWIELGSPAYLNRKQIDILEKASEMVPQPLPFTTGADGSFVVQLDIEPNSLVNLYIPS